MKVILFGASGMVGQGVLLECLRDPEVKSVLSVGRSALSKTDPKLQEIIRPNVAELADVEVQLQGYDACFFCLGVTSFRMAEADYRRITHDLTLAVAERLAKLNPAMTFIYVTGSGTDSTEQGKTMWARVKGQTENELLRLPFKAACMFRPGIIEPLDGIVSKTKIYNLIYTLMGRPLMALAKLIAPNAIVTTRQVGRAMIRVVREGAPKPVLEIRDIRAIG